MAERINMPPLSYSDAQLAAIEADPNHVHDQLRLWPTIRRLQADIEQERRCVRVLTLAYDDLAAKAIDRLLERAQDAEASHG